MMSTLWMVLGFGFLLLLAFEAGRSSDAARERTLRQRTAEEVRRLRTERAWLAAERERYERVVFEWRELAQSARPARAAGEDDDLDDSAPPLAA